MIQRVVTLAAVVVAFYILAFLGCLFIENFDPVRGWDRFKRMLASIGRFVSGIILDLAYFTLIAIYSIPVKLSMDPLHKSPGYSWIGRKTRDTDIESMRKQR